MQPRVITFLYNYCLRNPFRHEHRILPQVHCRYAVSPKRNTKPPKFRITALYSDWISKFGNWYRRTRSIEYWHFQRSNDEESTNNLLFDCLEFKIDCEPLRAPRHLMIASDLFEIFWSRMLFIRSNVDLPLETRRATLSPRNLSWILTKPNFS